MLHVNTSTSNPPCKVTYKIIIIIAFSRSSRTHPNLVSQALQVREIEIFVDCKLAAPLGFCRGIGPRFSVDLSRHACSLFL